MKEYFSLMQRIIDRKLIEFGLNPWLAYVLIILSFTGLAILFYAKTSLAPYIFVLFYLMIVSSLSEKKRNDFLRSCFPVEAYKKLRTIENLLAALPFAILLAVKQDYIFVLPILVIGLVFARIKLGSGFNLAIPSPFSKRPFEFSVGFRKTFYMFPIAYLLTGIAIYVGNGNIGLFSILLVYGVVLSFYANKENEFYIWSFAYSPAGFLLSKINTGLIYSTVLIIPITLSLLIAFPSDYLYIIVFTFLGMAYLVTTILAKYSAYPNDMSLPQVLVMLFCIILPPIMIFVIPSLFRRSVDRLKPILT